GGGGGGGLRHGRGAVAGGGVAGRRFLWDGGRGGPARGRPRLRRAGGRAAGRLVGPLPVAPVDATAGQPGPVWPGMTGKEKGMERRNFLKRVGGGVLAGLVLPGLAGTAAENDKADPKRIRIGQIGVGHAHAA